MSQRGPAVAGTFYPGRKEQLRETVNEMVDRGASKTKALGIISPHAGYIYSGRGAGMVFSRVEITDDVIILGVNHRGIGADVAIMSEGSWLTPLGETQIDSGLAKMISSGTRLVEEDESTHRNEHSLEVQLPFIQYFKPEAKIVPLCLSRMSYEECAELGKAIAGAVEKFGKPVLMVASSDMSHYIQAEEAKKKDNLALDKVLKLDPKGLYKTVYENEITMCGFIPAAVMLAAAIELGAKKAELVDYRNSGDVTGDYSEVVAYGSVMVR
jgi:hypothetical protein